MEHTARAYKHAVHQQAERYIVEHVVHGVYIVKLAGLETNTVTFPIAVFGY